MNELTDDRLLRYVAMLRHECAYKGPCKDNGDGCTCSAVELDARHMRTLRAAASTSTEGAGVKAAADQLLAALQRYGFPVSDAAVRPLMDGGSLEAQAVHVAAIQLRAALNPPAPKVTTDEAEEREVEP